jgi:hypothetical protein
MLVPDQLYSLTRPQDFVSQHFEAIRRNAITSYGVAEVSARVKVLSIPNDKALIVSSFWSWWTAAVSNELPYAVALSYCDVGQLPGTNDYTHIGVHGPQVAGGIGKAAITGCTCQSIIPGGHDVWVTAFLSTTATVAVASVNCGVSGVLVPRGNILTA